jgi:hypothetical protein
MMFLPPFLDSTQYFSISHTIGQTDLLHLLEHHVAKRFQVFQTNEVYLLLTF